MNAVLQKKLENLPRKPGVYIMLDKDAQVIYVGKAKILQNRVRQYFQSTDNMHVKTARMVSKIVDINYILTDTEAEALMLECNLIKQHHPFYNIMLRDDKSYPYLVLTTSENYPRLFLTRRRGREGNRSFGPFMNAGLSRSVGETINQAYPLQKCKKQTRPGMKVGATCLYYHMGQCLGCCTGSVPLEAYRKLTDEVAQILAGNHRILTDKLIEEMTKRADELNYEAAGALKQSLGEVVSLFDEQQKVITDSPEDRDIIGAAYDDEAACIQVFVIRDGKMIDTQTRHMRVDRDSADDILTSFIGQYYASNPYVPSEILIPFAPGERPTLEEALTIQKGRKVTLKVPVRGDKLRLLKLAQSNAQMNIDNRRSRAENRQRTEDAALRELKEVLHVSLPVTRIESYDISNIANALMVGAMVVFAGAKKSSKDYRKFRIREVEVQNDTAAMAETVFRRFNRALSEENEETKNPKFLPVPELILVDGGTAHVNAVKNIISMFPWTVTVAGLVKDGHHKLRGLIDGDGNETALKELKKSAALLNEISEEVHRSAVGYHRQLRSANMTASELTEIEGVGKKRAMALIVKFGSIEAIAGASEEELSAAEGMNKKAAMAVWTHFHGGDSGEDIEEDQEGGFVQVEIDIGSESSSSDAED